MIVNHLTNSETINKTFNNSIDFLKKKRLSYLKQLQKTEFDCAIMDCRLQDLLQENEEFKIINLQYQATIKTINSKYVRTKEENKELNKKYKNICDQFNLTDRTQLKRSRTSLDLSEENSSNKRNVIRNENESTSNQSSIQNSKDVKLISQLNDDIRSKERKLSTLKQDLDSKNCKINSLQFENSKLSKEYHLLLDDYDDVTDKLNEYKNNFFDNKAKYDQLVDYSKSQKLKIIDLTESKVKLEKKCEELLNQKANELSRDPRITKLINSSKDKEISELKKQLNNYESNKKEINESNKKETNESNKKEINESNKQPIKINLKPIIKIDQQIQTDLEPKKKVESQNKSETINFQYFEQIKNLEEDKVKKQRSLNVLEQRLKQKEQQFIDKEKDFNELKLNLNKLQDNFSETNLKIEDLRKENYEHKKTIADKESKIIDLDNELANLRKESNDNEKQINLTLEPFKLKIKELEDENREKDELIKEYVKKIKDLEDSIALMEPQIRELNMEKNKSKNLTASKEKLELDLKSTKLLHENLREQCLKHAAYVNQLVLAKNEVDHRYNILHENTSLLKEKLAFYEDFYKLNNNNNLNNISPFSAFFQNVMQPNYQYPNQLMHLINEQQQQNLANQQQQNLANQQHHQLINQQQQQQLNNQQQHQLSNHQLHNAQQLIQNQRKIKQNNENQPNFRNLLLNGSHNGNNLINPNQQINNNQNSNSANMIFHNLLMNSNKQSLPQLSILKPNLSNQPQPPEYKPNKIEQQQQQHKKEDNSK